MQYSACNLKQLMKNIHPNDVSIIFVHGQKNISSDHTKNPAE